MRIIAGQWGGTRIHPPTTMPHTRPTTDIAKEGLFNILHHQLHWEGMHCLDLFAGTGAISYELASRGVAHVSLVEKDFKMVSFIKKNISTFNFSHLHVYAMNVFTFMSQCHNHFDLIFAGPPYQLPQLKDIPTLIFEQHLLKENGLFILEHTNEYNWETHPHFKQKRNYGTTIFSFFHS